MTSKKADVKDYSQYQTAALISHINKVRFKIMSIFTIVICDGT